MWFKREVYCITLLLDALSIGIKKSAHLVGTSKVIITE